MTVHETLTTKTETKTFNLENETSAKATKTRPSVGLAIETLKPSHIPDSLAIS